MKKVQLLLLSLAIILLPLGLYACNGDKAGRLSVKDVTTTSLKNAYHITDSINFEDVKVSVNYKNGTYDRLTKGEVDVELDEAKDDTQFILNTDGLASQTPGQLTAGSYDITCTVIGYTDPFELLTITVYDNLSFSHDLAMFTESLDIASYKETVANAGKEDETSFMVKQENYVIGDDNEFILKPTITLMEKDSGDISQIDNIKVNVDVYDVTNKTSDPILVDNTIYAFNNTTFGFDFTEEAVGHTYKITMLPADWTSDFAGNPITPVEFTVEVQDGWNAYSALDLGRINLFDGDKSVITNSDYIYKDSFCPRPIFYNTQTKTYERRDQLDLWRTFLESKGEEDLHEINGIFIHKDIKVTPNDLPEDFFVTEEESSYAAGSLRDFSYLYMHYLVDTDFILNGNCFKVDFSEIPVGLSNGNSDRLNIYTENQDTYSAGHSTAFIFQMDYNKSTKCEFINIETIGNTNGIISVENDEALKASGGLIMFKSYYGVTKVDNNISKSFLISMFPQGKNGSKSMDILNTRIYDCFNSGIFNYWSNNNTATNIEMKRFGGPCIMNVSGSTHSAGIIIDDTSVLESYVNGTEAWFVMQKATVIATMITGDLNNATSYYGKKAIINQDKKMNLIMIGLDYNYLTSEQEIIHSNITIGDYAQFSTDDQMTLAYLNATKAGQPPILKTSDGDYSYLNPASGIFNINFTNGQQTKVDQLTGDYLYVTYPYGKTAIGFMVEMYDVNQEA